MWWRCWCMQHFAYFEEPSTRLFPHFSLFSTYFTQPDCRWCIVMITWSWAVPTKESRTNQRGHWRGHGRGGSQGGSSVSMLTTTWPAAWSTVMTFSSTFTTSHFSAFHAPFLRVVIKSKDFTAKNTISLAISQARMFQAFQAIHQTSTLKKKEIR